MTLPPLTRVKTGLVLTWQGWLLALALVGVALWGLGTHLYGYLAHTEPVGGGVLVVEGWLPDEGLRQAKARFEAGGYRRMLVTGGPLQKGYHWPATRPMPPCRWRPSPSWVWNPPW